MATCVIRAGAEQNWRRERSVLYYRVEEPMGGCYLVSLDGAQETVCYAVYSEPAQDF